MVDFQIKRGDVVMIKGFDDIPEHQFRVDEVYQDFITGLAVTGPLAGEYGEPDIDMVLRLADE